MDLEKKILSRELQQYLYDSGKTISTAESCTAGQIAEAIIASPGASGYFKGGIVAYVDEVKHNVLGVSVDTLAKYTAVSEAVAIEMAEGACRVLNTDFAISITGVAGPTGGTPNKPVGMVCFGFYIDGKTMTATKKFGDLGRDAVRIASVEYVYTFLATMLPRVTGMKFKI